jgi:predicted transcriptional regulator
MAIKEITIKESKGAFYLFKKPSQTKEEFDFSGVASLRQVLGNEKARLLSVVKTDKPDSLYALAKKLNRGFKSVYSDVKLLEKFGFIELVKEKVNNRTRHKPRILADTITIHIKI